MRPLISIIIPSYNRGDVVGNALKSAILQKYRPLEIIVVDDGSSDNTRHVVQRLKKEYENKNDQLCIHYIFENNKGVSGARNTGIAHSNGKYICFLDSDDIYLPSKIPEQYLLLNKTHANCCFCWSTYEGDGFKYTNKPKQIGTDAVLSFLNGEILTSLNTWIFESNLIKDNKITFREGCSWGEDNEFLVKCIFYSHKIVPARQVLVKITSGRNDGLSKFSWEHIEKDIMIHKNILSFLQKQNISMERKNLYKNEIERDLLPKLTMNSLWVGYKYGNRVETRSYFHRYREILKRIKIKCDIYSIKYLIKFVLLSL